MARSRTTEAKNEAPADPKIDPQVDPQAPTEQSEQPAGTTPETGQTAAADTPDSEPAGPTTDPQNRPRAIPERGFLYHRDVPSGKLFEDADAYREALKAGWVDHPKKV